MTPVAVVVGLVGLGVGWLVWGIADRVLADRDEDIAPLPGWSRPVTMGVCGVLFTGTVISIGTGAVLVAYLWFVAATAALFLTDLRAQLIPDRISGPATTVGAVLLFGGAIADGDGDGLARAAIAGGIYFVALFVIYLVGRGQSFGGGDVKLAPLLGLFTGYLGWAHFAAAVALGFLLGGITAVVLVVFRLRKLRDHFAFGPVLILGAYGAIAWGEPLIDWYLR